MRALSNCQVDVLFSLQREGPQSDRGKRWAGKMRKLVALGHVQLSSVGDDGRYYASISDVGLEYIQDLLK